MKLVTRDELISQPINTLYREVDQHGDMGEILVFLGPLHDDFVCSTIYPYSIDDNRSVVSKTGRDGCFNNEQLYVILEKNDLLENLEYTQLALENFEKQN